MGDWGEWAVTYAGEGYNCSQCILKAAAEHYGITRLDDDILGMCKGIRGGFNLGCICSVPIAAIMVFGLLFDDDATKRAGLRFFARFQDEHGSLNCSSLKSDDCDMLIRSAAAIMAEIIEDGGA